MYYVDTTHIKEKNETVRMEFYSITLFALHFNQSNQVIIVL